ncbi:MAG TPA: branched-chain amino acid ABC transporter permease [Thermoplasmata archaeon]|nr:branched-chain amino acid ABC transporter permease [Thermoplasmata archaeon]
MSAVEARATPKGILTNLGFYISVAIIFSVLALGFNLQWGYTGLFNAGIAGFYLIGAYVAAIAITPPAPPIIVGDVVVYPGHLGGFSLPLVAGVLLAMLAAGGAAAIVALPALRLRADYLAIATLALAVILQIVTKNAQTITGGAIGVTSIPPPILFEGVDASFLNAITMVAIGAIVLFALFVVLQFTSESPWGRVLRAVRDDEEATMALGKNTFNYKLQAFALGGALMGLAGALYAVTLGYLSPESSFAPSVTFSVWVMVIVGGSGNNRGAIVGGFLIYGMEWLSVQVRDQAATGLADSYIFLRGLFADLGLGAILALVSIFIVGRMVSERRMQRVFVGATLAAYAATLALLGALSAGWVAAVFVLLGCLAFIIDRGRKSRTARAVLYAAAAVYAAGWGFILLQQLAPNAVADSFFYIRLMLIGVLLILLIIFRPEGILREKKRVLR